MYASWMRQGSSASCCRTASAAEGDEARYTYSTGNAHQMLVDRIGSDVIHFISSHLIILLVIFVIFVIFVIIVIFVIFGIIVMMP